MLVSSVKLQNFRCHEIYQLACEPQTTLILGKNGCGKTSVIEAIYEVLRGKSFRAVDREILRRGAEFYRVELEFKDGGKRAVSFDGERKIFYVRDHKYRRLPRNLQLPVVLFGFKDLNLPATSPERRRDYFDDVLERLSVSYTDDLRHYRQALKQRNQLIKQAADREEFFSWDILLAKYGCSLRRARQKYLKTINQQLTSTYQSIAHNNDEVQIKYLVDNSEVSATPRAISDTETYLNQLNQNLARDLVLGHTTFGVHRDQYEFIFNGNPAKGSASRGEVRSIMISLKLIEASDIEKATHQKPLILLDDVFSELDAERRQCLVENFQNHQIILTSTESY